MGWRYIYIWPKRERKSSVVSTTNFQENIYTFLIKISRYVVNFNFYFVYLIKCILNIPLRMNLILFIKSTT